MTITCRPGTDLSSEQLTWANQRAQEALDTLYGHPSWFDPKGLNGHPCRQIEPMGVREGYHKSRLGKALLVETLRRLHALGAERVVVETDDYRDDAMGLYERIGFREVEKLPIYGKDYSARG